MFEYRHLAYNIQTGAIINCNHGNYLKKQVAYTAKIDREFYKTSSTWRWCHDFGKKWDIEGLPTK